jgi:uncharacterized membrane protein
MAQARSKASTGLKPNVAGLLCYLLLWVTGLAFLILEKKDKFVRFHAIQSLIVFGAISVVYAILFWIPIVGWVFGWILWVFVFVLWIILMVKAYQGEKIKMPIAGDYAEKHA